MVESLRPSTSTDRESMEQGDVVIEAFLTSDPGKEFEATEKLEVASVIYHSENSTAEGYPGILRVIAPAYMSFVEGSDTFSTNYTSTLNETNLTVDTFGGGGGTFDFVFGGGLTYADVVQLNFTVTVDPTLMRAVGSGVEDSALVLTPVCVRNVFASYPPDDADSPYEHQTQCGSHVGVQFASTAPECFDIIPLEVEQCVWASSQISADYPPHHSTSDDPTQGDLVETIMRGGPYEKHPTHLSQDGSLR